jgi:hypothetical protein
LAAEVKRRSDERVAMVGAGEKCIVADRLDEKKTAGRKKWTQPCYILYNSVAGRGVIISEGVLDVLATWQAT